jgi:hypothetical protein
VDLVRVRLQRAELISAKAVCGQDAEYIAQLFRQDGVTKITIRDHAAPSPV